MKAMRILSLAVILSLILGVIAGCGTPATEEPMGEGEPAETTEEPAEETEE